MTLLRRLNLLTRNQSTNQAESSTMREPDLRPFMGNQIDKIFVYGTLKRTYLRHQSMKDCTFIEEDSVKGYLIDLGAFPAFIPEVTGTDVLGEVYSFDKSKEKDIISTLDSIEGVPNLYWRLPFLTQKGHIAWAYWMAANTLNEGHKMIYTGRWIGRNSPKCDFGMYMTQHHEKNWPRKPKMKWHGTAKCIVVQQDPEIQKECFDYVMMPERRDIILAEKYTKQIEEKKAAPEPPKNNNLVPLEWLGSADDKTHEVCNDIHVEGI